MVFHATGYVTEGTDMKRFGLRNGSGPRASGTMSSTMTFGLYESSKYSFWNAANSANFKGSKG